MTVSNLMAAKRMKKYRNIFSNAGWNLHAKLTDGELMANNLDGPQFYLLSSRP